MSVRKPLVLLVGLVMLWLSGCRSPYYTDKGAAVGGIAGGIAGAARGDQSGQAAGGAVVGTALGALTGAAIGDSMDAELERRQAVADARQRMAQAVSTSDVMTMTTSGLSDSVIIDHIRSNGVRSALTTADIIELHENGVSERVIDTLQQEAARQAAGPAVVSGTPVIVEESYIVPPYCGPRYLRYHHHPPLRRARHPGVSWGVSFSH